MGQWPFTFYEVLQILGIPIYKDGAEQIIINCPFCQGGDKDHHLYLYKSTDKYYCFKCGSHGGMLDFYRKIAHPSCTTKEAYREIMKKIYGSYGYKLPKHVWRNAKKQNPSNNLPAPNTEDSKVVENKSKVYEMLLSHLSLSDKHRENLQKRGLADSQIEKLEYKTFPVLNFEKIAYEILATGLSLDEIPGFYNENGKWKLVDINFYYDEAKHELKPFSHGKTGFLIPYRNYKGQILGMQIRYDVPAKKNRYFWLSTSSYPSGTKAQGWVHFACTEQEIRKCKRVYLTEGALKADIIHAKTKVPVIAIPGVKNTTALRSALLLLQKYGVTKVINAFDMDKFTNADVTSAHKKVRRIVMGMGFDYESLTWDSTYKGFDDFLNGSGVPVDERKAYVFSMHTSLSKTLDAKEYGQMLDEIRMVIQKHNGDTTNVLSSNLRPKINRRMKKNGNKN